MNKINWKNYVGIIGSLGFGFYLSYIAIFGNGFESGHSKSFMNFVNDLVGFVVNNTGPIPAALIFSGIGIATAFGSYRQRSKPSSN